MKQNKTDEKWHYQDRLAKEAKNTKKAPEAGRFHAKLKSSPRQGK